MVSAPPCSRPRLALLAIAFLSFAAIASLSGALSNVQSPSHSGGSKANGGALPRPGGDPPADADATSGNGGDPLTAAVSSASDAGPSAAGPTTGDALPSATSIGAAPAHELGGSRAARIPGDAALLASERAALAETLRGGGYEAAVWPPAASSPGGFALPTIAKAAIYNELFYSPFIPPDAYVLATRRILAALDADVIAHPAVQRMKRGRGGQGGTGRGWGIASPFTNKWRFYATHAAPRTHLCEVGFLAGHSAGVLLAATEVYAAAHPNAPKAQQLMEFDYKQPKSYYYVPGSAFFEKRYPGVFSIHYGLSTDTVPKALKSGALTRCDFVSLDGSKIVTDFAADLYHFSYVLDPAGVIIADDMDTKMVRQRLAESREPPARVREHNEAFVWLVARGAAEVVAMFDSEQWAFGNICFRLLLRRQALADVLLELLRVDEQSFGVYHKVKHMSASERREAEKKFQQRNRAMLAPLEMPPQR